MCTVLHIGLRKSNLMHWLGAPLVAPSSDFAWGPNGRICPRMTLQNTVRRVLAYAYQFTFVGKCYASVVHVGLAPSRFPSLILLSAPTEKLYKLGSLHVMTLCSLHPLESYSSAIIVRILYISQQVGIDASFARSSRKRPVRYFKVSQ